MQDDKKLSFAVVEDALDGRDSRNKSARGWSQTTANPTRQMSVRMREDVYDRFRMYCEQDRRTNGEMLEIMMTEWEKNTQK